MPCEPFDGPDMTVDNSSKQRLQQQSILEDKMPANVPRRDHVEKGVRGTNPPFVSSTTTVRLMISQKLEVLSSAKQQKAHLPQRQRAMCETAIRDHSRSSVVVPIDVAYMTSY